MLDKWAKFFDHPLAEQKAKKQKCVKVKYASKTDAKKTILNMEAEGCLKNDRMSIYMCPHCRAYHITSVVKKKHGNSNNSFRVIKNLKTK